MGYDLVHHYERYAWIIISIVMLFLWGLGGKAGYDINAQKPLEDTGRNLSADVLSFGGIVFGSFTGVSFTCMSSPTMADVDTHTSGLLLRQTTTAGYRSTRPAPVSLS